MGSTEFPALPAQGCIGFRLAAAQFAEVAVGSLHPFLLAVVDHGPVDRERDPNVGIRSGTQVGKGLERPSPHAVAVHRHQHVENAVSGGGAFASISINITPTVSLLGNGPRFQRTGVHEITVTTQFHEELRGGRVEIGRQIDARAKVEIVVPAPLEANP